MGADIARLDAHGVTRLVSLMPGLAILDSGMGGLEIELLGYGIQWTHLPIIEGPEHDEFFERELVRFAEEIRPAVIAGECIAIHSDGWATGFESHLHRVLMVLDDSLTVTKAKRVVTVGLCYANSVYK